MLELKMLAAPVIGAVIGYCTNWIAVKMLFRPRYPKYIFGHKLPFTPGIIPKGKERLAKALGKAAADQLFNRETVKNIFLSDRVRSAITDEVDTCISDIAEENLSLRDYLNKLGGTGTFTNEIEKIEKYVSFRIQQNILSMDVGGIVARKLADTVQEKVQGTMLAMMVNDSLVNSLTNQVAEGINQYATQNIGDITDVIVHQECNRLLDKPTCEYGALITESGVTLGTLVLSTYERLVEEKLDTILGLIDIKGVVMDRVNSMSVEEVEKLTLSVMKKELGAVVNLGALIGFILGLFNMFFYN